MTVPKINKFVGRPRIHNDTKEPIALTSLLIASLQQQINELKRRVEELEWQ